MNRVRYCIMASALAGMRPGTDIVVVYCAIQLALRVLRGHKRHAGEEEEAGGLHRGGGGKRRCCWQKLN